MKNSILFALTVILLISFSCNKEEDDSSDDNNNNTPANSGTFLDFRDGKTYEWIRIGDQVWMTENLAYKVNEGCWAYDNDESNVETYGYLYNWETAINVCPDGWHLPSDEEWKTLEMHLGMSQDEADKITWRGTNEGKKLKSTSGWNDGGSGTDEVDFTALPGGNSHMDDYFSNLGDSGMWWSATEYSSSDAFWRALLSPEDGVYRFFSNKDDKGISIRCIKD